MAKLGRKKPYIIRRLNHPPELSLNLLNCGFWSRVAAKLATLGGALGSNPWICCWFWVAKVQGLDPVC